MMSKQLDKAPEFNLPDENSTKKSLNDYRGKWVVLYFYPKDDTPGCTIEACSLRDVRDDLAEMGAEVIGISKDAQDSHDKFKAKYSLNFSLLSDETGEVIKSYGAWGKKMFGIEGIQRKTFIINPTGYIVKTYGKVTPLGHGERVKNDLKSLMEN